MKKKPAGDESEIPSSGLRRQAEESLVARPAAAHEALPGDAERKLADEERRTGEEVLRLLIENAPAALAIFDREMRYLAASRRWAADYNLGEQRIIGRSHYDIFPELQEGLKAVHRRALAGEVVHADEDRFVRADGSVQWVKWEVRPWHDSGGCIGGVIIFSEDITERKTAQLVLRRSAALLNASQSLARIGGWEWDVTNGIMSWTDETYRIHDLEPGAIAMGSDAHIARSVECYDAADRPVVLAAFQECVASGRPYDLEFPFTTFKGRRLWIRTSARAVMNEGKVERVVGLIMDITERKQAEAALRRANEQLVVAQNSAGAGMWDWDMGKDSVEWSPELFRLFGLDPAKDKASFEAWGRIIHPEDLLMARRRIDDAVRTRSRLESEYRVVLPSGETRWISALGDVSCNEQGEPVRMSGICLDITERKRAAEELSRSKTLLRDVVDLVPAYICAKNREGRFLLVNRKLADFYGKPIDKITGMLHADLCEDREELRAMLAADREVMESGRPKMIPEETMQKPDGNIAVLETYKIPFTADGKPAVLIAAADITERKRAEQALRTSEAQLSNALQISRAGHWEYDVASDTFTFNDNFYRIFRATAEAVGGYTMRSADYARRFCHPGDAPLVAQETRVAIETTDPNYSRQLEHRILYADGEVGWIAVRFFVVKDAQGRTVKTFGVNQDITERKKSEEALRESRELLRTVLDAIPVRVFWKDRNLRYLGCNAPFARDAGLDEPEDLLGKDDFAMGWRDQAELYRADDRAVIESGKPRLLVEEPQTTPSGETIHLLTSKLPLRNADGTIGGVLGTYFDITERKRAEQALREGENLLNEVGRIAQIGGWEMDLVTRKARWTRATYDIVGIKPGDPVPGPDEHLQYYIEEDRPKVQEAMRATIEDGVSLDFEARAEIRGRGMRWFRALGQPVREEGRCVRVCGTLQDITESKKVEEELKESEKRLSEAQRMARLGYWSWDVKTGDVTWSDEVYRIFQLDPGTFKPQIDSILALSPWPEDHERDKELIRRATTNREKGSYEQRFLRPDQSVGYYASTFEGRYNDQGELLSIVGTVQDITEKKQSERLQILSAGVLEVLNKPIPLQDAAAEVLALIKHETGLDAAGIRLKKGEDFPYLSTEGLSDEFVLAENSLTARGEDGEFCRDENGNISLECTCGLVLSEKCGPPGDAVTPAGTFWTSDAETLSASMRSEDPRLHPRNRCLHVGFMSVALIPIRVENRIIGLLHLVSKRKGQFTAGTIRYFEGLAASLGIAIARKQAEEALHASELRFRDLVENINDIIYAATADGVVTYVSPSVMNVMGYKPEEVAGRSYVEFLDPRDLAMQEQLLKDVLAGKSYPVDFRMRTKSGNTKWVRTLSTPILENGRPVGLRGVMTDITERKQAEEALSESREFAHSTIDALTANVCVLDERGRIIAVNKAWREFAAANPPIAGNVEEGADYLAVCDAVQGAESESAHAFASGIRAVLRGEQDQFELEYACHSPTVQRWFVARVSKFAGEGAPRVVVAHENITAIKQAEESLRLAELRYRTIFEQAPDAVVILDPQNTRFIEFNDQLCRQLGYTREEFAQLSVNDIDVIESEADARARMDGVMRTGRADFETRQKTKQGEIRDVQVTAQAIEIMGKTVYHCIWRDITERKQAQETVRQSEARLRLALQSAKAGSWEWNLATGLNAWSDELWALYGVDRKGREASYDVWKESVHPQDRESVERTIQEASRAGQEISSEWRVNTADGSERWLLSRGQPVRNEKGAVTMYRGIVLDITDRKKAEAAIREQLDELRRWHEAVVGREGRVMELKREVNELLVRQGKAPRYESVEAEPGQETG